MTILVVDHGYSTRCGIRDLGVRIADRLGAVHVDCNSWEYYVHVCRKFEADVVIVNYRADLMPWWRPATAAGQLAILHQYGPTTVDRRAADLLAQGFDHVLVLDPTVQPSDPRVHAVARPLPPGPTNESVWRAAHASEWPRIGSFGFAFPHKGFAEVASEVATIPGAVYNLHIPEAYFNGAAGESLYRPGIISDVNDRLSVGGGFHITWQDLEPVELVDRLAANTVNCLLYAPGQPDAGLSSALDYLIAACRPMLVSSAEMFAAAQGRAAVWPGVRLADVLADLDHWQAQARDLWHLTAGRFEVDVNVILETP